MQKFSISKKPGITSRLSLYLFHLQAFHTAPSRILFLSDAILLISTHLKIVFLSAGEFFLCKACCLCSYCFYFLVRTFFGSRHVYFIAFCPTDLLPANFYSLLSIFLYNNGRLCRACHQLYSVCSFTINGFAIYFLVSFYLVIIGSSCF